MIRNLIKNQPLLFIILVLAFIIRLIAGYVQSFSNDELSALYRIQCSNFSDLIHWGIKVDGHPALVQLFLYYYASLVPRGEVFIRLPFILASTISLGFIFFSLKKLSGELTAYMVTIILAFAGFSIELGYFARPYAFGILFASIATYYWIRVFIEKEKAKKHLILFILFSIFAAYTHYFALLEIVVLGMATFVFSIWKLWWKIILAAIIGFMTFLPHYPITKFQMSVGGIGGWLGKPKDYFILDLWFEYFDRSAIIFGVFVLISMLGIIFKPNAPQIKKTFILGFLSLVPFMILYYYSIKINSVLQFSACFFLMPFLLAAFFSLFETDITQSKHIKWVYVSVMLVFLSSTLYSNNVFAPTHFAEFKKIATYIEEHESDSVTTVVAVNNPFYINYYLKDKKPDLYITDMGDNLSFLKKYIDSCNTQEFIYAFMNQRSNAEIPFLIRSKFYDIKKIDYYTNSELYHFDNEGKYSDESPLKLLHEYILNAETRVFEKMDEYEDPYSEYQLFSNAEFSPTFKIKIADLHLKPYSKIVASVYIRGVDHCDLEMIISIENGKEVFFWRSRKLSYQYGVYDNFEKDSLIQQREVWRLIVINRHFAIGETLQDDNINLKEHYLKAYIWNPNHCDCLLSKFSVGIYEGNSHSNRYQQ